MVTRRLQCFLLTAFVAFGGTKALAESIHQQLQKQVPAVLEYLAGKDVKTVGVLKFRVAKPGEKLTDGAGPANSLIADRLEVGLILANSFDESKQLKIIKDASSQVEKIEGATHLTAAGREAIFGPRYKLAWGGESVTADAFLTGIIQVHEDSKTASVGLLCLLKNEEKLERACDVFEADLDASTLSELGESFLLRGAFDGGTSQLTFEDRQEERQQLVIQQAKQVKTQAATFPLNDSAAPLKMEVLFDGRPVTIETRQGRAFIPEPVTGQNVEVKLACNGDSPQRLGVVLKVNGENTLYRQTNRDIDCAKWILSTQNPSVLVRGYQSSDRTTAEKFKVLSRSDSAKKAIDYGRNVGQIQLTVFQELTGPKPKPKLVDGDEEDLIAMFRGIQPEETPVNLSVLKGRLRSAGRDDQQTRGLIVQGEKTDNAVQVVTFNPDPTPVMSVTITYYKP